MLARPEPRAERRAGGPRAPSRHAHRPASFRPRFPDRDFPKRPLVNSPVSPSAPDRAPLGRAAAWAGFALLLAAGVYFYFRHAGEVIPLLARGLDR